MKKKVLVLVATVALLALLMPSCIVPAVTPTPVSTPAPVTPAAPSGGKTVFWICEGTYSSIATSLIFARSFKLAGVDVEVIFDEEALVALAEKKYDLPAMLQPYAETIKKNLAAAGIPTDPAAWPALVKAAGVPMYACGGWAGWLGVADKLPAGIEVKPGAWVVAELAAAAKVIGAP